MSIFLNQDKVTGGFKRKRQLAQMLMGANSKNYASPWAAVGDLAQFYVGNRLNKNADKQESDEKETKRQKLQDIFSSGGDVNQLAAALMGNAGTEDFGLKMKMQGIESDNKLKLAERMQDSQFAMAGKTREAKLEMLGRELGVRKQYEPQVASVKEYEYRQGLSPEQDASFLTGKRANRMYDMGGGYQRFSENGNKPQEYYQKTVKQEDLPEFRAKVAQQTTQAQDGEKNRQVWLAKEPEKINELQKFGTATNRMVGRVGEAKEMINEFTTGLVGGLLSNVNESDAGILKGRVDQIKQIVVQDIMGSITGQMFTDFDQKGYEKSLGLLETSTTPKELNYALDQIMERTKRIQSDAENLYKLEKDRFGNPQQVQQQAQAVQQQQVQPTQQEAAQWGSPLQGGTDTSGGIQPYYGKTKMKPSKYGALLDGLAKESGLDPALVRAVSYAESADKVDAKSHKGAYGLMQVMPKTLKDAGYGIAPAKDNSLEETTRVGVQYLSAMMKKYDGDLDKALAAYNAGSGNVDKYGGVPPFNETKKYIGRIKGYLTPQGQEGFNQPQPAQPLPAQAVATPQQMDNGGNTAPIQVQNPIVNNNLPVNVPTNTAQKVTNFPDFSDLSQKVEGISEESLISTAKENNMTIQQVIDILRSKN